MLRIVKSATVICALVMLPFAGASAATEDEKDMLGMMYLVQMAPKVCEWTDAGPSTSIDAQVKAAEAATNLGADETAAIKTKAEAELRKDATNCAKDGMVRSMYNDAAAGK